MRCASASASTTRIVNCTVRCSTRNCSPRSIWPLTAGQGDLAFALPGSEARRDAAAGPQASPALLRVQRASAEEDALHRARLERIAKGGKLLWTEPAPNTEADPAMA